MNPGVKGGVGGFCQKVEVLKLVFYVYFTEFGQNFVMIVEPCKICDFELFKWFVLCL